MKKVTAILLIGCLVFCAAGYHFVFRLQVWQAKSEMMHRLLHSPLQNNITELSFNSLEQEKLQWDGDHEFSLNGEMYDVITQYSQGGKLYVRCVADKKETSLVEEYLKLNKSNSDNKPLSYLVQLVTAPFILPVTFLPQPSIAQLNGQFVSYTSTIVSITRLTHTPPPKLC